MVASVGIASEFQLVTAATGNVVSVTDLKDHLRYLSGDQDSFISELQDMAVARIEHESRRQLLTATWKLLLPCFPSVIEIRKCPVASITSITYLDVDGATQTLSSSVYDTFLQREPGEIHLAYSQSWPATRTNEQAVTVNFTTGYGVAADCPAQSRHLVKLIVEEGFWGAGNATPTIFSTGDLTISRLMSHLQWGM